MRTLDDGGAVVPAVEEFEPNVCILDIEMPGASGHAIAAELRGIYKWERPFMIAISGKWYSASDRLVAMGAGFDYFLASASGWRPSRLRRSKARTQARFALRPHAAHDGVQ